MAKKKRTKATAEEFIKAVMGARTVREAAESLGCSHQAVSKRLQHYREKGVKGLPEFDGRSFDVADVQQMVNKYKGK